MQEGAEKGTPKNKENDNDNGVIILRWEIEAAKGKRCAGEHPLDNHQSFNSTCNNIYENNKNTWKNEITTYWVGSKSSRMRKWVPKSAVVALELQVWHGAHMPWMITVLVKSGDNNARLIIGSNVFKKR